MADFITRLAERALGVAPVVQPVMPSMFAPEPISHSPGLERDSEATTSPGDLDRPRTPLAQETPPAPDAPTGRPAAMAQQEDQSGVALSSAMPGSPRGTPESRPGPSHLSESGSSERGAMTGKEDQRGSSQTTARHPQTSPETRPETLHRAEPGPTRHRALSTSQRVLPENSPLGLPSAEDESGEAVFRPLRTLLDGGQGETLPPVPSPGAQASLDASEDTPPPIAPRMVRPQLDGYLERGPQEPRVAAPESSAPAIRVTIGRIEVRAITPPPMPPAQRTTPARPGPELSLDDYLKQHNGGHR